MKKRGLLSLLVLFCVLSSTASAGDASLPPPDFNKSIVWSFQH